MVRSLFAAVLYHKLIRNSVERRINFESQKLENNNLGNTQTFGTKNKE
jgi:hypothetical protein